jgi:hypothetical protein
MDKKKRTAPKKAKRKKAKPVKRRGRITPEEEKRLFDLWCELKGDSGYSGVAREGKRALSTIRDLAERENWEERFLKIKKKVQAKSDNDVAKRRADKMKLATGLARSALVGLYEEIQDPAFPDDPSKKLRVLKTTPTISDVIRANKYEDEIFEKFPEGGDETASTMTADQVETALTVLATLGKAGLEALGNMIVERARLGDKPVRKK